MENILQKLWDLQDPAYALFQSRLTPGIPVDSFIGVRVPDARKLAKKIFREGEPSDFLSLLPHTYFDENMLHALILSEMTDYDTCISYVDAFLPYVDNWAVCDTMSPKVFRTHKEKLIEKIREWSCAAHVFTCRFGLKMLMQHFLDKDFTPEYPEIPAGIHSEEYYVNMMIAWYFAEALAKQWDHVIPYLTENRLDVWAHNKTIQKACESRKITDQQKTYLRKLKR